MTALTKPRMTVDEFLAWAAGRPGRYELFRGEVYAMSPEAVGHAKIKGAVYGALVSGIRQRNLPCHVLPDGVTIRIDETTAYEPDAQVYCGPELPSIFRRSLPAISGCRASRITSSSIPPSPSSFIIRAAQATRSLRASSRRDASRSIRPGWNWR
jgi:hypothetical protein